MRGLIAGGAIVLAAATCGGAAAGCTVIVPYRPLSAVPPGTARTFLADVVATDFRPSLGPVARLRVVRSSDRNVIPGAEIVLPYLRSPCDEVREPRRGQRLVVYVAAGRALGWATPPEAVRFDRRFR